MSEGSNDDPAGNVTAKSNLNTVDTVNARISAGTAARCDDFRSGDETEIHEVIGDTRRKVKLLQDGSLTFFQVGESSYPDVGEVENHFQFHLRL